jgi:hypothetical protein
MEPKFVQIGDWAFNPNHIQEIHFSPEEKVAIYWHLPEGTDGDYDHQTLTGVQAEAFRNWWANKADVFAA